MRNCRICLTTERVYKASLLKPLKREACRGQTLVEFALVAMTFFLLAFALIDFSWLMFSQMNMQDAVREAGRYAATGNSVSGLSRVASITQVLDQAANAANVQGCTVTFSNSAGTVGPGWQSDAGGPGANVTITAVRVPLLTTAIGKILRKATISFISPRVPPLRTSLFRVQTN